MKFLPRLRLRSCLINLLGGAILAFGIYHVHSISHVTEGCAVGLTLLLEYWMDISPAVSNFVISAICYLLGWRTLGSEFIIYSAISAGSFSVSYAFLEQFPRLWPQLAHMPLTACFVGALFVGIGIGLCVRAGGAPCGDDALAMSLVRLTSIPIQWIYLASDLIVLALSLSYIPVRRLVYSLLTVILSGQIIGWMQVRRPHISPEPDAGTVGLS